MTNPWLAVIKAAYADAYLKALAATCNTRVAQDAAVARLAAGVEAALRVQHQAGEDNGVGDRCGTMIDTDEAFADAMPATLAAFRAATKEGT
jgi:hypothetical protein